MLPIVTRPWEGPRICRVEWHGPIHVDRRAPQNLLILAIHIVCAHVVGVMGYLKLDVSVCVEYGGSGIV